MYFISPHRVRLSRNTERLAGAATQDLERTRAILGGSIAEVTLGVEVRSVLAPDAIHHDPIEGMSLIARRYCTWLPKELAALIQIRYNIHKVRDKLVDPNPTKSLWVDLCSNIELATFTFAADSGLELPNG